MIPNGRFITFEGLDGSGKTTQVRKLAAWLESQGHTVVVTRQPGGTQLGDRIRGVVLDSGTEENTGQIAPFAEMALMFADRAQVIAEVITPALEAGSIVLCDRWTDSTEAYQGGGRGIDTDAILHMHAAVCGDLWPRLTLLLLPDLEASLARARRRNERSKQTIGKDENRFEAETDTFFHRVHAQYVRIAEREQERVVLINGDGSIDEVEQAVRTSVVERLGL